MDCNGASYNITFSEKTYIYDFDRQVYPNANQHCVDMYNGTLVEADEMKTLSAIRPVRTEFPDGCEDNYFTIGLSNHSGVLSGINGSTPSSMIEI